MQTLETVKTTTENGMIKPVKEISEIDSIVQAGNYLKSGRYEEDIKYFRRYKDRKTGLSSEIEKHLTLYPGLAVLGGASSLGKTTFAVNLAESLIDRGEAVLFFTLEQQPIEIITKSLAAALYTKNPDTTLTNIDIKNGETDPELEGIRAAYIEQGRPFFIITCNWTTTAATIEACIKDWIRAHDDRRPVVIVDYLQLVAPQRGEKGDMRATVDGNLKAFKRIQRDNELFLLLISSFNRSSYQDPVSYASFKESGMIEYTADYVWALQYYIQRSSNDDYYLKEGKGGGIVQTTSPEKLEKLEAEQRKIPREIQFVSLKSRNGRQVYDATFYYYPDHDKYSEWARTTGDVFKEKAEKAKRQAAAQRRTTKK